ncbi:hypothetical protein TNCV_2277031 [Trichonephila clavipes]|nr:hypothetical protein TNCV_2277031 [Trichonephila clavipes]
MKGKNETVRYCTTTVYTLKCYHTLDFKNSGDVIHCRCSDPWSAALINAAVPISVDAPISAATAIINHH